MLSGKLFYPSFSQNFNMNAACLLTHAATPGFMLKWTHPFIHGSVFLHIFSPIDQVSSTLDNIWLFW